MSQQVGTIDLGLDINQAGFNRQIRGIAGGAERSMMGAFKGLGKMIGATLGVAAVASFGKSCLTLGSDLTEVQNVVDVTFGAMAEDINQFASTAITQFGLSETSAKRYSSTMGAMLKSMGMTTKQALTMSKTITGLSADMASFYNLKSQEAFDKIRAGISGETEPLKQLGINMSVANMEAFALSQGIGKAYSKMSQAEQTLLRYNYLLSVTADAQGDFARTSDSWANQTRILSEQFNALKATLGQAFINVLTPVVRWLNTLVLRLQQAAAYFKAFTDMIFGTKAQSGGGVGSVVSDMSSVAAGADNASSAIGGMGDSAKDAAKKAKGALAGFDEINSLSMSQDDGSAGGGAADIGGVGDIDLGSMDSAIDAIDGKFQSMIDKVKNEISSLKNMFKMGFNIGIGGDYESKINSIRDSISGIKQSFKDIFTDGNVTGSFKRMTDSLAINLGKVAGSAVSIGTTIAQNLLGGVNKYLAQNKEYIQQRLVGIFDATGRIASLWGTFSETFADIFSVLGGDTGQQITANIIGIFANAWLGTQELMLTWGADILNAIIQPIEENREQIKTAIENTLKPIESVTGTIRDFVTNTFSKILDAYYQYIQPAYQNIAAGLSEIVRAVLDMYNANVKPVMDEFAAKFDEVFTQYIQPMVNSFIELVGEIALAISELYKDVIAPIAAKIIKDIGPQLQLVFSVIADVFFAAAQIITTNLKLMFDNLKEFIAFIKNVFKGDWEAAWGNIKNIFSNAKEAMGQNLGSLKTLFGDFVNHIKTYVQQKWSEAWNANKTIFATFKQDVATKVGEIKQKFTDIVSYISGGFKTAWSNSWNSMKSTFNSTWNDMKNSAKNSINGIIDHLNGMIRGINNKLRFTMPEILGGGNVGFSIPSIPKLARGGIIDQPTLAMVGEAGKEAVVPLENTAFVDTLASALANAVIAAMTAMQSYSNGNNNDQQQEVVVAIEGMELVRILIPLLKKELKRTGVTLA